MLINNSKVVVLICISQNNIGILPKIKEIKYIEDYKNDELVKEYCDQLKVEINKF